MNRRGFLAAILAAGAAPAIVKAANIMPVFVRRESGLIVPSGAELIRESMQYDIYHDLLLVRYDVLIGARHQYGVDMRFNNVDEYKKHLPQSKEIVRRLFDDSIKHDGLSWADARPLPAITNFKEGT